MFGDKSEKSKKQASIQEEFLEGIKKDMTNRAAIAAKQEATIKNLVEEIQAERKEMKALRVLYQKRMAMDDEIIDKFLLALEKRKQ